MADPTADNAPDVKENGSAEVESKGGEAEDWDRPGEGTKYNSLGRANSKTLTELMSPHALKGKDLVLSEEEEQRLAAELGNWINADANPYETGDDPYFKKDGAEEPTPAE